MKCPHCQAENESNAVFCASCGAKLQDTQSSFDELQAEYEEYKKKAEGNKLVISEDIQQKYDEMAAKRAEELGISLAMNEKNPLADKDTVRTLVTENGDTLVFDACDYLKI